MATLVTGTPVNIATDIVLGLDVLAALTSGRTSSARAFTSTSSDHTVAIDGFGSRRNPVGGEPNTGTINRLTVLCGDLIQNLADTVTGLGTGREVVVPNTTGTASYATLLAVLHDDDTVAGSDDSHPDLMHATLGADTTHGGIGNDTLDGDEGDDHSLFGRDDNDHLNGGAHDDESMCLWWGG